MHKLMKIAYQVSHSFHNKNPHIDFDDILSESHLIMIRAMETFDPEKGRSLNSWVAFLIHRNLKKIFAEHLPCVEYNDSLSRNDQFNPERIFFFKEALKSMSSASKEVINLIMKENVVTKKEIKTELRNKGFAWNKIQKAFCELKKFANAL